MTFLDAGFLAAGFLAGGDFFKGEGFAFAVFFGSEQLSWQRRVRGGRFLLPCSRSFFGAGFSTVFFLLGGRDEPFYGPAFGQTNDCVAGFHIHHGFPTTAERLRSGASSRRDLLGGRLEQVQGHDGIRLPIPTPASLPAG